jgi:hypothetical protein
MLPELNLEAGAGDEYPQMGTGTIGVPTKKVMVPVEPEKPAKKKTAKKGKKEEKPELEVKILARMAIEPDLQKLASLRDERQVWVQLDKPFVRKEREETPRRKRDKARVVTALAIPEWLLKPLKEN